MSTTTEYECEECGYDLTTLAVRAQPTRCPECGCEYPWPPTERRSPWPGPVTIALGMCGPTFALVVILLAGVLAMGDSLVGFFLPAIPFIWLFAAVGGPAITASEITRRCVLRPQRRRVRWALQLTGAAINLAITFLGLLFLRNS